MEYLQYLFWVPIGLYGLLWVITYGWAVRRLLKVTYQCPGYGLAAQERVPGYLQDLFRVAIAELTPLEFQPVSYLQCQDFVRLDGRLSWGVLLYHQDTKTYAIVELRRPIEPSNPFYIEFLTLFQDKSRLRTLNGSLHGMLGEFPHTVLQDPYTPDVAVQWRIHQEKLQALNVDKAICGLSPGAWAKDIYEYFQVYVQGLVNAKHFQPIPGTHWWKIRRRSAFKLAFQGVVGSHKVSGLLRQRRQRFKKNPDLQFELPIELEVEEFQRMQQFEQLKPQQQQSRKARMNLLLISLALFAASVTVMPWFKGYTILLLIGVIFLHELGHYVAMQLCGYQDTKMFFVPFFGAAVTGRKDDATLTQKVVMLLAGPLPGLLLGIGLAIATTSTKLPDWASEGIWMLIALNLFNLLPIFPLDGGKITHLLWFSRYPYTDVLFKLFAVAALIFLSGGHPVLVGMGLLVGLTIPAGFRSAKVDGQLRKELTPILVTPNTDSRDLLKQIFHTLKQFGYGKLPFIQRYQLVKDLVQRQRESQAKWSARIGLSGLYSVSLMGGLVGSLFALTPNFPNLVMRTVDRKLAFKEPLERVEIELRKNPQNLKALVRRGHLLMAMENWDEAIATANQIISLKSQAPEGYYLLARIQLAQGQKFNETRYFNNSLQLVNQAIQRDPQSVSAYELRSRIRVALNDFDGAQADERKADNLIRENLRRDKVKQIGQANQTLKQDPKNAEAYAQRAAAFIYLKHPDQGLKDLTQAIQLDPKNVEFYRDRSNLFMQLKNYPEALADANQVVQLAPNQARSHLLRGRVHKLAGNAAAAKSDLDKARALLTQNSAAQTTPSSSPSP